jgi:hypothetical protein
LNDVDDILLSAAASKCFSKLTNVTTDDHVHATGRFKPISDKQQHGSFGLLPL